MADAMLLMWRFDPDEVDSSFTESPDPVGDPELSEWIREAISAAVKELPTLEPDLVRRPGATDGEEELDPSLRLVKPLVFLAWARSKQWGSDTFLALPMPDVFWEILRQADLEGTAPIYPVLEVSTDELTPRPVEEWVADELWLVQVGCALLAGELPSHHYRWPRAMWFANQYRTGDHIHETWRKKGSPLALEALVRGNRGPPLAISFNYRGSEIFGIAIAGHDAGHLSFQWREADLEALGLEVFSNNAQALVEPAYFVKWAATKFPVPDGLRPLLEHGTAALKADVTMAADQQPDQRHVRKQQAAPDLDKTDRAILKALADTPGFMHFVEIREAMPSRLRVDRRTVGRHVKKMAAAHPPFVEKKNRKGARITENGKRFAPSGWPK